MTKRQGNFEPNNNKKPKLDDDIARLWGDDLDVDEDAVEDCIRLASQVPTQLDNITILPTYSAFREKNSIISSTQIISNSNPSTSKYDPVTKKGPGTESEKEIKALRQQREEKEGEVAILRLQLRETKIHNQLEQEKSQNEFKQKLNALEKQIKSIKSELEFKNLEIVNLKQQISNQTKHNFNTTLNGTQNINNQERKTEKSLIKDTHSQKIHSKLQASLTLDYPLQGIITDSIFNIPKHEQYIIETKLTHPCRNSIPYLQNQSKSMTTAIDKSDLSIDFVYPEMLKLINCTEDQLNLDETRDSINKIICTCEQFLDDLQEFLDDIKNNLRTEDILETDTNYLKQEQHECSGTNQDEIAIIYKKYVCQDTELLFENKEFYTRKFPYIAKKKQKYRHVYFLNTLLSVVRTFGEIVLTSSDIFCNVMKEVLLSKPRVEVICQLTLLFKVVSKHSTFVEYLFNKSRHSISSRKGILYFNEDACRFYIFVMLFDNTVFRLERKYFSMNLCLNLLCFMYNTFNTSNWIHHRDIKECECVPQLYKLEIEIVFRALEKYIEDVKRNQRSTEWDHFFKKSNHIIELEKIKHQ
ncbi:hypothetical protein NQ317_005776 [Molorchus minor]|uniref:ATR-interacting protein n=1 Tax=Molorchus minor TaxID=1323400 RepID=A0ABQ9JAZ2_9CUCU|nr:hypothetical protein NQ317_005776 [Molorchus minor]